MRTLILLMFLTGVAHAVPSPEGMTPPPPAKTSGIGIGSDQNLAQVPRDLVPKGQPREQVVPQGIVTVGYNELPVMHCKPRCAAA